MIKYWKTCTLANIFMFLIPLCALCGWTFEIEALKTFLSSGGIGMNPMSGICFLFLGTSFYLANFKPEKNYYLFFACVPLFIGLMQVSEYIHSFDVHLDQFLFADQLRGNIMSPNSAGTFVLASIALLTFHSRAFHGISFPAVFSLGVAWMALLACTGYLYGVKALYGVTEYIPMALNTAITFAFFACGVLFSKCDLEPTRTILSDTQAGRFARYLIPPALMFPVASAWLRIRGEALQMYDPMLGVTVFVLINVLVWGVVLWTTAYWLYKAEMKNKHLMTLLEEKAKLDPLTGLWNRRYFDDRLEASYNSLERHGRAFSCIVLDVDYFKKVNDHFGHPFGDHVLKQVANILLKCARKEDIVCRIGGEEFVLILPDTDIHMAAQMGERLRVEIANTPMENEDISMKITSSFGVAQATVRGEPIMDIADGRLYKAKQSGRNRVVAADAVVFVKSA